ncbi:MAG: ABC transporter substrate-binding protein [Trueperaceae bacterium]|nr:ABC transporter substrate-binding protein [Trueperaceae bacterium]
MRAVLGSLPSLHCSPHPWRQSIASALGGLVNRSIPTPRTPVDEGAARRALARVALALLALVALSAALAQGVVDDLGRTVTLDRPPLRIVTMVPSHTEAVCALGRCDALVGRDTFSNFPPTVLALPDLGSAFSPDLEALVALEPDLVLVDEFSGIAEALAPFGIAVYAGTPQSFEEIFELFERLGRLLDARTEAAVLEGRIRGEIAAIKAITAGASAPSVYYELDASPYSVGPDGFIGTLIAFAGGDNIVTADLGDFPLLDPEYVVASDPELIVLADAPYGESIETLRARAGWSGLQAVVDGRVFELDAAQVDVISRAGPRVADGVALLARLFHPDRF